MKSKISKIVMYIDMMTCGGAQRVMANLANYFVCEEVEVVLINDFKLNDDTPQYILDKKVKRYYLREKMEGNVILKNLERIVRLRKIVKNEKPDLVLSFLGRPNKRMLIATIGLKTKKVVSVRNDPNREYATGGLQKWFIRNLFKMANGCVFQTVEAGKYFSEKFQSKSTVILNPVDSKFFNVCRTENPQNIVTAGRMESQKNQKMLIRAFSRIVDEFPNEKLIIYGDGKLRLELERLCKDLNIADKVDMPGNISNVEEKFANAKIFVLSSDYEGLPNALMEAMAVGIPCISTDCPCGGPNSLISSEKNGILVPVGDVEIMAETMKDLLKNKAKRQSLEINARNRAKVFKTDVILSQWDSYLTDIVWSQEC